MDTRKSSFFPSNCKRKTISHPSSISKKHTAPGCSHGETCSQYLQCHFSTCSSMKPGNLGPRPFVHVAERFWLLYRCSGKLFPTGSGRQSRRSSYEQNR